MAMHNGREVPDLSAFTFFRISIRCFANGNSRYFANEETLVAKPAYVGAPAAHVKVRQLPPPSRFGNRVLLARVLANGTESCITWTKSAFWNRAFPLFSN